MARFRLWGLDPYPDLKPKDRRRNPEVAQRGGGHEGEMGHRDLLRSRWPDGEESRAVPLFPVTAFTPQSTCAHNGPIREGSVFYCPICHQYGREAHISKPAAAKGTKYTPHPRLKGGTA